MYTRKKLTKKDFVWTSYSAKEVEKLANDLVSVKAERYDAIKAIPKEERTFENTIEAVEYSSQGLPEKGSRIHLLSQVHPKRGTREAARKAEVKISSALIDLEYDVELYRAYREYAERGEVLQGEEKKLFEDMGKGFRQMGFGLPRRDRALLMKKLKRMYELSNIFENRINDWEDSILVTKEELEGLPDSYISNLKKEKNGKYKVTLQYPDLFPFLSGAKSTKKRKELMDKDLQKGGEKNIKILKELLELRKEQAKILGYKSYPDLRVELRTAKNEKNIRSFLSDILKNTRSATEKEMKELERVKGAPLRYYDLSYYFKQLRKEKFQLDSDLLKEYFPLQSVKGEMLSLFSSLFDVSFAKRKEFPMWHESVELYEVKSKKGETLSYFGLDLYPRKGKYGHAMVAPVQTGQLERSGRRYHPALAFMVANFPRPNKKNPSLMSHSEIETLFHEFGHLMHHVLSDAKYPTQSGTSVAWDFVETPSQLFENWAWDETTIRRMSSHYKTGKKLPERMLRSLIKSRSYGAAYTARRTAVLALTDIELHTKKIANPNAFYRSLQKKYTGVALPANHNRLAGFAHIAGGYDSGYYSYLWAEVFAYDLFTRFEKKGKRNKKVGKELRRKVLERGSSAPELSLVADFLGRKPNNKAFLKGIGAR
ncbi:MAG: M3 family metallopeptidase [Candidatus Paceibacterota bacterium]